MRPLRFYEHFACAYGTIWLLMLAFSFLTQQHIDAGAFGLFGFPVIALIYAFVRKSNEAHTTDEVAVLRSQVRALRGELQRQGDRYGISGDASPPAETDPPPKPPPLP